MVFEDTYKAVTIREIKIPIPIKKYHRWNFPETIVPSAMMDSTYSAVFVNVLTKRFFSLSLKNRVA